MENKIKITFYFFFLLQIFSCIERNKSETQKVGNNNKLLKNEFLQFTGRIVKQKDSSFFEIRELKYEEPNKLIFSHVTTTNNDRLLISKTIDSSSFHLLGLFEEEANKINNPFYLNGRMLAYYRDKKNIYAFINKDTPQFILLGRWEKTELLGGNYLRVENRIFSNGFVIPDADSSSFHTLKTWPAHLKTEWSFTIGLDKKHLYSDEKIMDIKMFNRFFYKSDSLRQIYFKTLDEY